MKLTPAEKEELEYYIEVYKGVERRDSLRHSFWNAIIICNSFFLAIFAILVAIYPDREQIKGYIPFLWIIIAPITLCLFNHWLSYRVINKRMWQRLDHSKFLNQEAYPNSNWPHKDKKIFEEHNRTFRNLEWLSIILTAGIIMYFLSIVADLL